MFRYILIVVFAFLLFHVSSAQDLSKYNGAWKGEFSHSEFYFFYHITPIDASGYTFSLFNKGKQIVQEDFKVNTFGAFSFSINDDKQKIWGTISEKETSIFLQSGFLVFHQSLALKDGKFQGKWKLFNLEHLKNQAFYLSVVNASKDGYEAYAYLGDNRFSGFWCGNFKREKNTLHFTDAKTGVTFIGILEEDVFRLRMWFGKAEIAQLQLQRTVADRKIGFEDWKEAFVYAEDETLKQLELNILNGNIANTNSILVTRKGEVLYEQYFNGFDATSYHDQRSAAKSVGSTLIGILQQEGILKSIEQSIYDFLPPALAYTKTKEKEAISIKSLLTMSSGLDAIDFGINRNSVASEGNYQSSANWTKTVLEAPMINKPFTVAYYGGGNAHLLGVAYANSVTHPYQFMHEQLFRPLGITEYIIQTDDEGRPYFGGGMHFTTRDMIKYGQMYLEGGNLILSQEWVEQSFKKYFKLENVADKNEYGFLFWHRDYQFNGQTHASIEARGNGGQYIFIIPELELVAAITSSNFSNIQQPEMIMENYLLPFVLK